MDSNQFSQTLKSFSQKIIEELPSINAKIALNAYGMTKDRIDEFGTIGENQSLGEYSDASIPLFFTKNGKVMAPFSSGERIKKARDLYEKKKKAGEGMSYKEWRTANNLPTDHVTLSFSGTTINDIGVIKELKEGVRVVTIVGPKNTKTRLNGKTTSEIVGYLQERYGDFIKPNKEETKILEQTMNNEVSKLIKKSL